MSEREREREREREKERKRERAREREGKKEKRSMYISVITTLAVIVKDCRALYLLSPYGARLEIESFCIVCTFETLPPCS